MIANQIWVPVPLARSGIVELGKRTLHLISQKGLAFQLYFYIHDIFSKTGKSHSYYNLSRTLLTPLPCFFPVQTKQIALTDCILAL